MQGESYMHKSTPLKNDSLSEKYLSCPAVSLYMEFQ